MFTTLHFTKDKTTHSYTFTNNVKSLYLINNHIRHMIFHQNHPNELLVEVVIWCLFHQNYLITLKKIRAHLVILNNDIPNNFTMHTTRTAPLWHFKILVEHPHITPNWHLIPYIWKDYIASSWPQYACLTKWLTTTTPLSAQLFLIMFGRMHRHSTYSVANTWAIIGNTPFGLLNFSYLYWIWNLQCNLRFGSCAPLRGGTHVTSSPIALLPTCIFGRL